MGSPQPKQHQHQHAKDAIVIHVLDRTDAALVLEGGELLLTVLLRIRGRTDALSQSVSESVSQLASQ